MSGRRSHSGHAGECSREPAIDAVVSPRRIRCVHSVNPRIPSPLFWLLLVGVSAPRTLRSRRRCRRLRWAVGRTYAQVVS